MRKILPILLFIVMLSSCATHKNKPVKLVGTEKFQHELVDFYANPTTTPLNEEEIAIFKGITFFPINEKYNIKADFTPIHTSIVQIYITNTSATPMSNAIFNFHNHAGNIKNFGNFCSNNAQNSRMPIRTGQN